ncbi:hypothetical protein GCM10017673_23660 [Streptosporangium violaceochromogenes]|nr:hypothetical protein GCM10017673_23660 [Streptosporangium violaceochromogenes]
MRLLPVLLLLGVPALEIWVLIQAGRAAGGWPTAALLLAGALAGAWILRREGRRAWSGLQEALRTGRTPARGPAGRGMVVAGGVLLLVPGFVTDVLALLCLLPPTRPLVRGLGVRLFARRIRTLAEAAGTPGPLFGGPGQPSGAAPGPGAGHVIHGEVIRDEPGGRTGRGGQAGRGAGRDLPSSDTGR